MGMKPIALSFKNTPEDKELYDWIFSHSNLSGFIKDTLRAVMLKGSDKDYLDNKNNKQNGLIDIDF